MKKTTLYMLIMLFFCSCRTSGNVKTMEEQMNIIPLVKKEEYLTGGSAAVSSPKVFVYKTKDDYSRLVPVLMDDTRTRIVSYPHPNDLIVGDKLRIPTPLDNGYLLDNRGINRNVAFLSYTYEEYTQLSVAPSMQELMAHIQDKYPLTEWHDCGRRADYKNIVSELNKLIEQGFLQK